MRIFDAAQTAAALEWKPLIDALREQFASECVMPLRHHHSFEIPDEPDGTLLLMPAWQVGGYLGVKQVCVVPGNSVRSLPAIYGIYILSSARTGEALALFDGAELTARRTAAASALAADFLARPNATRLLIVGAGRLSLNLALAHSAVRDIRDIRIWARRREQAVDVCRAGVAAGLNMMPAEDLRDAAEHADIISCCTLSQKPLIKGNWLKNGTHLDLVGAFKPTMRETDDMAVKRASLFVDTRDGALAEGGDIVQPIRAGVIAAADIRADLFDLCRAGYPGTRTSNEITLFKSVGAALEDLSAAKLAYETATD